MRPIAIALFAASLLSMCALLVGLLPPFTLAEYVPAILGALGVAVILIHDDRKGKHRD